MVAILKIDHIGIRVREKQRSIAFYEMFGFELVADVGFEKGHPVIMRHSSGVVLNLLGPGTEADDQNVLMDIERKYAGYTHMALRVESLADLRAFLEENGIEETGSFSFKGMHALFIRDPDRNVIEFDEYAGEDPAARGGSGNRDNAGYGQHP